MRMSLCMVVGRRKALARCLEGIADAVEEIVIVDMGSTDRTKEIARQFTDKIYDFPWVDDFAAARNFAFSKGTGEYLLWMDAEDILPSGEKEKLLALKADLRENPCDMVMMLLIGALTRGTDEIFLLQRATWCAVVRRRGGRGVQMRGFRPSEASV